jgi:hypothetical protein
MIASFPSVPERRRGSSLIPNGTGALLDFRLNPPEAVGQRKQSLPFLAHFGHAAIAELSPVSGIKRKLDFEPAKGSFWRKAAVQIPEEEFIKRLGQIFCPWSTS